MRTLCAIFAGLALLACHPAPAPTPLRSTRADSLVLERSRCFGFCPAYRLSLRADGSVTFASRNPGDTARTATDSISPEQLGQLVQEAERIGFFELPPDILKDSTLCPVAATDHPSATVTIFRADSAHRVVDYLGCRFASDASATERLEALRHFESAIDSVAQSERWVRPASLRN